MTKAGEEPKNQTTDTTLLKFTYNSDYMVARNLQSSLIPRPSFNTPRGKGRVPRGGGGSGDETIYSVADSKGEAARQQLIIVNCKSHGCYVVRALSLLFYNFPRYMKQNIQFSVSIL